MIKKFDEISCILCGEKNKDKDKYCSDCTELLNIEKKFIEQKLDNISSDMFCIGPGARINLTQWRRTSEGGGGFVDTHWSGDQWHDTVQECFRHRNFSMTCWLDGHVSEIARTTGEDIPTRWYTGVVEE